MKKLVAFIFVILFLLSASAYYFYWNWTSPRCKSVHQLRSVKIPPKTSISQIIAILHTKKIISNPLLFKIGLKLFAPKANLKAGMYQLSPCWSPQKIFEVLAQGKEKLFPITIPEGLAWWQVASILAKHQIVSQQEFYQAFTDPVLLKQFQIPASNAEGYLFPSTYFLSQTKHYTGKEIIRLFLNTFKRETQTFLHGRNPEQIQKIIVLASLVEKETNRPAEKPIIAGVFLNRLAKNMLLQCDPTIIYGIGPEFNGDITRKDLHNPNNPYNTYVHPGLPPGPICSPGLDSIQAVLHPIKHSYLYFVAKGDGTHVFSKTFTEHLKAVRKFQLKK